MTPGSSVPAWIIGCTVMPFLNCDGTTFFSPVIARYPALSSILGSSVVLPDACGHVSYELMQPLGSINHADLPLTTLPRSS